MAPQLISRQAGIFQEKVQAFPAGQGEGPNIPFNLPAGQSLLIGALIHWGTKDPEWVGNLPGNQVQFHLSTSGIGLMGKLYLLLVIGIFLSY